MQHILRATTRLCVTQRIPKTTFFYSFSTQKDIEAKLQQLYKQHQDIQNLSDKIPIRYSIIEALQDLHKASGEIKQRPQYDGYYWDLLQMCQIHVQVGQDQKCEELLKTILEADYQSEFINRSELDNILFLSSLNNFVCNFYFEKKIDLQKAKEYAIKGHKCNIQLLDKYCPSLEATVGKKEIKNPDTAFGIEMHIINGTTKHLFFISNLFKMQGNIGEAIKYLSEKAQLHDQTSHMLQKIIQKELEPKITKEEEEKLSQMMMQLLVEQAVTFSMIAQEYYQINDATECFEFLKGSYECFDYLIENKVIEEIHPFYIQTQLLKVQAIYRFQWQDFNKEKELERLEKIIKNAETVIPEDILMMIQFDYHYFLQDKEGNQIEKLETILSKLKKVSSQQGLEYEIKLRSKKISTLISQQKFEQAWLESQALLKIFENNQKINFNSLMEAILEGIELARTNQYYEEGQKLLNQAEELMKMKQLLAYTSDFYVVKGKFQIEQGLKENKNQEKIANGLQNLETVLKLSKTVESNEDQKLQILDLQAYYFDKLGETEKTKDALELSLKILQDSEKKDKERIIEEINKKLKTL